MGWTGMPDRGQTALDEGRSYIYRNSSSTRCPWHWKIVKDVAVKTRDYNAGVYFAALENWDTGKRILFVMLCERSYGEFRYKDLTEESGPCVSCCPIDIIEAVGPTTDKYALGFRRRCYRFAKRQMPDYNQLELNLI